MRRHNGSLTATGMPREEARVEQQTHYSLSPKDCKIS